MKRNNGKSRSARRATAFPWPPPSFALREAAPDPLRQGGSLRVHAAQATLEAVLRQRLPVGLRPGSGAEGAHGEPLLLAGWPVDAAPPRAANGDDDLMSAAQDGAPSGPPGHATPASPATTTPVTAGAAPAESAPTRRSRPGAGPDLQALFRIF